MVEDEASSVSLFMIPDRPLVVLYSSLASSHLLVFDLRSHFDRNENKNKQKIDGWVYGCSYSISSRANPKRRWQGISSGENTEHWDREAAVDCKRKREANEIYINIK